MINQMYGDLKRLLKAKKLRIKLDKDLKLFESYTQLTDQIPIAKKVSPFIDILADISAKNLPNNLESCDGRSHNQYFDPLFFPNPANYELLMNHIRSCKVSIKVCIYHLTNKPLAHLLLELYQRGITVQVITEHSMLHKQGSQNFLKILLEKSCNKITIKTGTPTNGLLGLMHCKYFIIDDELIGSGSLNWTKQAMQNNHEILMMANDKRIVQKFMQHFNTLFWQGSSIQIKDKLIIIERRIEMLKPIYGELQNNILSDLCLRDDENQSRPEDVDFIVDLSEYNAQNLEDYKNCIIID